MALPSPRGPTEWLLPPESLRGPGRCVAGSSTPGRGRGCGGAVPIAVPASPMPPPPLPRGEGAPTCPPAPSSARRSDKDLCDRGCAAGGLATPTTPTGPRSGGDNAGREQLSPMRQPSFASPGRPPLRLPPAPAACRRRRSCRRGLQRRRHRDVDEQRRERGPQPGRVDDLVERLKRSERKYERKFAKNAKRRCKRKFAKSTNESGPS